MRQESHEFWDEAATTFDNSPDHGLRDLLVRNVWLEQLRHWLPSPPASILDIGCGTGSLSLLMAELGYQVTGIDFSPAMLALAEAKAQAAGQTIRFQLMDAADPQFEKQRFELILCRHLLWIFPDPPTVLQRWTKLLQPMGRLLLIEGFWHTGAGMHAQSVVAALPSSYAHVSVQSLSEHPELWGGSVTDERYALIADLTG